MLKVWNINGADKKAKTEEMPETIKHTESIQRQQSKNEYEPDYN